MTNVYHKQFAKQFSDACNSGDLIIVKQMQFQHLCVILIDNNKNVIRKNQTIDKNITRDLNAINKHFYKTYLKQPQNAQEVIEMTKERFRKPTFNLFCNVCFNGQIEVAKWLYSLNAQQLYRRAFMYACHGGHIDIAQWLLQIDTTNLIQHPHTINSAFNLACHGGHIELIKWLYPIANPNEDVLERAYKWALQNSNSNELCLLLLNLHKLKYQLQESSELQATWNPSSAQVSVTPETCGICLETQANRITPCNHQFCETCIKQWYNEFCHTSCPCCRQTFSSVRTIS